ncbi:MAG: helicase HerA-like domain-containing protein [Actinomycetes bacterium]
MGDAGLFIGEQLDAAGTRNGEAVRLDPNDLTTHGVIVGMTGSGKTGLAVALMEEVLSSGVPIIAIDPKGDLTNLLLSFPELRPEDFAPWVPEGGDPVAVAADWAKGLADWGIGPDQVAAFRRSVRMGVYTPGSTAATPLNLVGALTAPTNADDESLTAEIDALTAGLLGMVGITGDPLASPEHLLLSNIVHHAWTAGRSLDMATLLAQVQDPPMRTLGVMEVETIIPAKARTALAVKLNGLLAAPGFAAWTQGAPLDIEQLLFSSDGRASLSVVAISHLSDAERQMAVSRILAAVVRWFRGQPGSDRLRALVYLDEVAGYAPPTAEPATKQPILTILKQARAFGVGMVLATQNPVDLDYKAMSNAGTWLVGRLQTERDKARLLEGMSSAAGNVDVKELDGAISGLAKRQFFLHQAKGGTPKKFGSRWAMSYLRGPVTGLQLADLPGSEEIPAVVAAAASDGAGTEPASDGPGGTPPPVVDAAPPGADTAPPGVDSAPPGVDVRPPGVDAAPSRDTAAAASAGSVHPPKVADGVPVRFLDPAVPWGAEVGLVPGSSRLQAGLALRVGVMFDDRRADVRQEQEWEAVLTPLGDFVDVMAAVAVDHDDRDLLVDPPPEARYLPTAARIDTKTFYTDLSSKLKDHLSRTLVLEVPHNAELKLYGRPDESPEAFAARCDEAAQTAADAEAEKIRVKLAARIDRLRDAVSTAEQKALGAQAAAADARSTAVVDGVGSLLTGFLGGRSRTRGIVTAAKRAKTGNDRVNRAQQRAEEAANTVAVKVNDLAALEEELTSQLVAIDDRWRAAADAVTTAQITLSKTDISVRMLSLVWVPV